ncbi:MAG TPA: hypothetical protein VLC91_14740 [Spongiibacteraceae bacterium]|nr:hypothetical protein [Spongiibacteraceae bacterium]
MHALRLSVQLLLVGALTACTPAYVQQSATTAASQMRLNDAISVQHSNERLLSRQSQICLVSSTSDTESGLAVLHAMQVGFSGYFLAVNVENEAMDYLRALASDACAGASYLFYVQPQGQSDCSGNTETCPSVNYSQFVITIVSWTDKKLVDRVTVSVKEGLLQAQKSDSERLQKAFGQLASALSGAP